MEMRSSWGIVFPLDDWADCREQFNEQTREINSRIEHQCSNPGSVPVKSGFVMDTRLVRCRKCPACMLMRQRQWAHRAFREFLIAGRTWWVTLTYRGNAEPSYEDVKRFFARLRKKHKFRYLISEERGDETNRLHWHVLVHCDSCLQKRHLEAAWLLGNIHARLAKSAGLGCYLAKYAAKQSRIRASVSYGCPFHFAASCPSGVAEDIERFVTTGEKSALLLRAGVRLSRHGLDFSQDGARELLLSPPF